MKMNSMRKMLSVILVMALIAALALSGCGGETAEKPEAMTISGGEILGQGAASFTFTVVDRDGKEVTATVNTDKETVGEALMELGLIDGEQGPYGLYVLTVNGQTVTWEEDGMFWAFYIDGESALTGVDMTDLVSGASYMFKVE